MKTFRIVLISMTFLLGAFALSSCGGNHDEAHEGKEYTSAYICPMHCEGSGSEEMGKCPACGMDYVANKDHKGEGHNH